MHPEDETKFQSEHKYFVLKMTFVQILDSSNAAELK